MPHPELSLNALLHAAQSAYSGLPITLEEPTPAEQQTGVRRFSYTEDDRSVSGAARMDGGMVQLLSIEVRPTSPDATISALMLKAVHVGRITASLRTLLALDRARREGAATFSYDDGAAPAKSSKRPRRGGRPTVTDSTLRWLAEAYLLETAEGRPGRAVERIAERIGRPDETVRTWLARARKEGWLAPGTRGRAGGEPGPKLIAKNLSSPEINRSSS